VLRAVCASANPHKVAEIAELVVGVLELVAPPAGLPEIAETADSLVGNARLKAAAVADATGLPALADDTGLEVHALGGRPGVHTARFAALAGSRSGDVADRATTDADNRAHLLAVLARVPHTGGGRNARFRTVVVLRWPAPTAPEPTAPGPLTPVAPRPASAPRELVVEGVCEGHIVEAPRGTRGFGYDSLFVPREGDGRTFAEMTAAEKHALSHRGRAFAALRRALVDANAR
jgi:XTP/dITP diphosphohydrolase